MILPWSSKKFKYIKWLISILQKKKKSQVSYGRRPKEVSHRSLCLKLYTEVVGNDLSQLGNSLELDSTISSLY